MDPVLVNDTDALDFTQVGLKGKGFKALIAGDQRAIRLQVIDENGAAVALTGATIRMMMKQNITDADASAKFSRRTGTLITGSTYQIAIDADQVNEDTVNFTGKGWFQINFHQNDQASMITAAGKWLYEIRIQYADGTMDTLARGQAEIVLPGVRTP